LTRQSPLIHSSAVPVVRRIVMRAMLASLPSSQASRGRREIPGRGRLIVGRWVWVVVVAACLLGSLAASAQASSFTPGRLGDLDYHLFVSSAHDGSRALPLVVYLHGCGQAAPDVAVGTRWNQQAQDDGFLVLYPEQSPARNSGRCWNWQSAANQARDGGEAKLIADATRDVITRYRVDARRVFVIGASAGGAMTQVMAATYPDVYAAAANLGGCGYATCLDVSGRLAYRAMGPRARPVPLLAAGGTLDPLPLLGVSTAVQQWLTTSDFADDATANGSISRTPASTVTRPATADAYAYTTDVYDDRRGEELVQLIVVHGAGHVYLGGDPAGSFTDPKGPAYTPAAWAFFSRHPMPTP
jgi:poly(hydroxyalkanoate) depolymerase family esterase